MKMALACASVLLHEGNTDVLSSWKTLSSGDDPEVASELVHGEEEAIAPSSKTGHYAEASSAQASVLLLGGVKLTGVPPASRISVA